MTPRTQESRPVTWPNAPAADLGREARVQRGKAARTRAPRSGQGVWEPAADRSDPVAILMDQASSRIQELVPVRNGRMLGSAFAFYRGSAAIMAADLARTPTSGFQAQLCGDAHLSNFGGYASPDRQLVFDLNDFDETLPGPWEWDVKRLMASLVIAGRDRGFDDHERATVVRAASAAYRQTMRDMAELSHLEVWYSRLTAAEIRKRWGSQAGKKALQQFDRQVEKATTKHHVRAAAKLTGTVNGETRFLSDPPLITPVSELVREGEAAAFAEIIEESLRAYRGSLTGSHRHLIEQFRYVDAARKVVGVGSVGTRAWVVLMLGIVDDAPLVLQLKEARRSVLAPASGRSAYQKQGQRVVVGQQLMQASSDIFLGWARVTGLDGVARDFYFRQLWDWKVSAEVGRQSPANMGIYAQMCAWVLARAHARSSDRVAVAAYLGTSNVFDAAMVEFAEAYADQNERDYEQFLAAAREQRIEVSLGH
ncbi:MAG: DUF2252 domain-containing protein [Marmoricola sp.]